MVTHLQAADSASRLSDSSRMSSMHSKVLLPRRLMSVFCHSTLSSCFGKEAGHVSELCGFWCSPTSFSSYLKHLVLHTSPGANQWTSPGHTRTAHVIDLDRHLQKQGGNQRCSLLGANKRRKPKLKGLVEST